MTVPKVKLVSQVAATKIQALEEVIVAAIQGVRWGRSVTKRTDKLGVALQRLVVRLVTARKVKTAAMEFAPPPVRLFIVVARLDVPKVPAAARPTTNGEHARTKPRANRLVIVRKVKIVIVASVSGHSLQSIVVQRLDVPKDRLVTTLKTKQVCVLRPPVKVRVTVPTKASLVFVVAAPS